MLDGNVLLRQKRDEVPEGTLSCPDQNLAVFHHYRHYEGLRLLPSVCDSKLIQQTLISRDLNIADSSKAAKFLGEVSYFRFVQYLRPMEADKATHQFKPKILS